VLATAALLKRENLCKMCTLLTTNVNQSYACAPQRPTIYQLRQECRTALWLSGGRNQVGARLHRPVNINKLDWLRGLSLIIWAMLSDVKLHYLYRGLQWHQVTWRWSMQKWVCQLRHVCKSWKV